MGRRDSKTGGCRIGIVTSGNRSTTKKKKLPSSRNSDKYNIATAPSFSVTTVRSSGEATDNSMKKK
jgi:hypothetical protein